MKKFIALIAFLSLSLAITHAQDAVGTPEDVAAFYNTTTCVVLDGDMFQNYDSKIKEAVEKHWKSTPFEFISMEEFKKRMDNPKYSFLIRTKAVFEKDKSSTSYSFLSLLIGKKNSKNLNRLPDLGSFPLSYYNVDYDKYTYKLGAIVQFLQNHVALVKDNPDITGDNVLKYYSKNLQGIDKQELYFIKGELADNVNEKDKIQKYYSGKVKCVDGDRIKEAINNEESVIFLHKVGPPKGKSGTRCYKILLGANDGKLYYWEHHKIKAPKKPDGFLESDFKQLEKMK